MALSDYTIRGAKPGAKPIKLSDEKGLFLLLQPSGGKLWRLKYRFDGKEKKLGLGRYPDVTLKEARARRDGARALIANGVDPGAQKLAEALAAKLNAGTTFKSVGDEYLDKASREGRAAVTIRKSRWLLDLMEPDLG
ncbi:MAG: Arm DNA-binding domain-containing protein, partial [Sphingomonas bacterium]|nr:Arm DNA-binding domain-containing protein [Sphingomonas bacterium]